MMDAMTDSSSDGLYPDSTLQMCMYQMGTTLGRAEHSAKVLTEVVTRWLDYNPLTRSVVVVDDSPPALCALASILSSLGVPIHAVTTDPDPDLHSTLKSLGAIPHLVSNFSEASEVWRTLRSAVVVIDINLDESTNGLNLLMGIGRGPRAVLVSSECTTDSSRISAGRASMLADAISMFRTDSGSWEKELRDLVGDLLDLLDLIAPVET